MATHRASLAAGPKLRAPLAIGLAVLIALAGFGGGLAETARADDAQVTVVSPGGAEQTLSLDALGGQEDVVGRSYAVRSSTGETAQTVTGFSLAAILNTAGVDPYGFSYLEAQRPAGGSVLLSRHQALDLSAFADGPPVVYATATGTGFMRPSAGGEDLNATDSFEAPQGIALVLRKDSPLQVRAEASTQRTRPGTTVTFTAIVERAGSGEQLSYSWYFDDGSSASGPRARHSFTERGSYDVVVGVTTPGDRAGTSAVVTVQVGKPLSGPDRKGGGKNKAAEAPDHGVASGSGGGVPTTSAPSPVTAPAPSASGPKPERKSTTPPPSGQQVSGLLLTSAKATPPEPTTAVARTGKLSGGDGGTGLPGTALGLLATVGLLGAGALIETRSLLR